MKASLLFFLALGLTGCGADPADDAFARQFVEYLRAQDPAGAAQLQPASEISSKPWPEITAMFAKYFPKGQDSLHLIGWEKLHDSTGTYRKLTYSVIGATDESTVGIWLITDGQRVYVNTINMTGLTKRHKPEASR